MEDLKRLAEEVAKAYLRYLKAQTGSDHVTYDGVTKSISVDELAFGLVGVAHYNAKIAPDNPDVSDPYKHLSKMINVFSKPYSITDVGVLIIEAMNKKSIHKQQGEAM